MSTYVVMEAQQGARKFLVWSLFDGGPGYSDVTYTTLEGEPVAHVDDDVRVTRFLFTVPGPEAPAPSDRVIFTTEYLASGHGETSVEHALLAVDPYIARRFEEGEEVHVRVDARRIRWSKAYRVFVTVTEPAS